METQGGALESQTRDLGCKERKERRACWSRESLEKM